jgi:methylglutaconyl-CoA hydratase
MGTIVTIEQYHHRGGVVVSLNRPDSHNALNPTLIAELTEAFAGLSEQTQYRVVILTGRGRSFCAGADLRGVISSADEGYESALDDGLGIYDLMAAVSRCPLPVIGRVDGWAIGGGMGLVACCDLVVASDRAKFGFSEVRLGLIPAIITPFVLTRVHPNAARQLYLTGERFDAQRASDIGLVDQVVGSTGLDDQVAKWFQLLMKGAPGAQADVKQLLREISFRGQDELRSYTSGRFAKRVVTDEAREGIQAFLEKRDPNWFDWGLDL